MANEIRNDDDLIDSRNVIARIEELEGYQIEDNILKDEVSELDALRNLNARGEEHGEDWEYGCTMIRHSYTDTYFREFCEEVDHETFSDMPSYIKDAIDWDVVAEALLEDYTEITFDGEAYYVRTA